MSGLWIGANLLCHVCKYASNCDKCCNECEDTCNSAQRCFYSEYGNDFISAKKKKDFRSFSGLNLFEVWEDRFREDGFGKEMDKILGKNNKERTHASPTATQGDFLRKSEGNIMNQNNQGQVENESTIAKVSNHSQGVTSILDSESGNFVEITPELQRNAMYVHGQIQLGTFAIALAIKKIYDEKLYLGLGCSSRKEYAETMLPFGRKQAEKYYKVADKVSQFMPELKENGASMRHLEPGDTEKLDGIGMAKLYELTKLEDADFEEIMEGNEVNGVSLEEIKAASVREATAEIKRIRDAYSKKLAVQDEAIKTLKAEKQANDDKIRAAEEKLNTAKAIEDKFRREAGSVEDKQRAIKAAKSLLDEASMLIGACGVDVTDPETLQQEFLSMADKMALMINIMKTSYGEIFLSMEHRM